MKRLRLIITLSAIAFAQLSYAQYYSINFDTKTVAAMVSAYAAGTAAEAYYDEQVQDILKHYTNSEVATAGIFASKYLERRARTELGIWSSSTENYYYRRIYNMVSKKIIPKTWTVAKMMLQSPQTAINWLSYIMKVCNDTKSLCMQFESIVTNSTLSFSDIAFLEVKEEIASVLELSKLGNVDWQSLLEDIAQIPDGFSKESLQSDIDNLYSMGVSLATAGTTSIGEALLRQNSFYGVMSGKISKIISIYESYSDLFGQIEDNAGQTLLGLIGGEGNVSGLFSFGSYSLSSWISDYVEDESDTYYTQRWYIARVDSGCISLCDYYPPTDDDSILTGGEWTRFETTDSNFSPSSSQREQVLSNSESYAGWSRSRVKQLNSQNDGFDYDISYSMSGYVISRGGKQTKKAYAYDIHVTQSWDNEEVVYEAVFDSYSMDLTVFRAQLNALLSEFNDNEDGYTYYIASDRKRSYKATSAEKLSGCETVTISVTCTGGASLGQGTHQYKCRTCGSSLSEHTKECSMKTTLDDEDLDLSELYEMQEEAEDKISSLQSQIEELEQENKTLLTMISITSVDHAEPLRTQYNKNKMLILALESDLFEWEQQLEEIEQALYEALNDDAETDDYYRIPAIMQDCKTAYGITWQGDGSWSGYTYTREGTIPNINGTITFEATLTMARKPKYFLGIKIHRAIIQIDWELSTEYTDTHVADVMTLDTGMSDEEKAEQVNERISEIAQEYPDCDITTEYAASDSSDTDTDDTYHLLWSSDRLEIAREVDSRLTRIYADLVSLEKMMHYKYSIVDVLLGVLPDVDDDQGRRQSLVDKCHERWMRSAEKATAGEEGP